jgi:hypothetical protein
MAAQVSPSTLDSAIIIALCCSQLDGMTMSRETVDGIEHTWAPPDAAELPWATEPSTDSTWNDWFGVPLGIPTTQFRSDHGGHIRGG